MTLGGNLNFSLEVEIDISYVGGWARMDVLQASRLFCIGVSHEP